MAVEFNNARKVIPQIAANLHAAGHSRVAQLRNEGQTEQHNADREGRVLQLWADNELNRLLGQQRTRSNWDDPTSLYADERNQFVAARRRERGVLKTPHRLTAPKVCSSLPPWVDFWMRSEEEEAPLLIPLGFRMDEMANTGMD